MERSSEERKRVTYDDLRPALINTTRLAHRNLMNEARQGGAYGFHYGLARQSVDRAVDGRVVYSESSFEGSGRFNAKYVVIDYDTETAIAWEGQGVNNTEHVGYAWELSLAEYNTIITTTEELLRDHPV